MNQEQFGKIAEFMADCAKVEMQEKIDAHITVLETIRELLEGKFQKRGAGLAKQLINMALGDRPTWEGYKKLWFAEEMAECCDTEIPDMLRVLSLVNFKETPITWSETLPKPAFSVEAKEIK